MLYTNRYLFIWGGDNNQEVKKVTFLNIIHNDPLKNVVLSASTSFGSLRIEVLVPKGGTFLLSVK